MRAFSIPHNGAVHFGHEEWRMAIHLAIGADTYGPGRHRPGYHRMITDTKGVHPITCKYLKGREITKRHDSLVRHLKHFFAKRGARVHNTNQEELGWFTGTLRPDIVADVI